MSASRWHLSGPGAETALDWLHVHADVHGVLETAAGYEVWLAGSMPAGFAPAEATVTALPIGDELFGHTGLERDAALLVAPDLCVRPPWVARPAGFAGVELVVPRGGAFGSGEHGSTRAALAALHAAWPAGGVASCIDVGTGSGILALYAAARGVPRLHACDLDRAAVAAAAALVPGLHVVHGGPAALAAPADLVVANLAAGELAAVFADLLRLRAPAGLLVVSGLRVGAEARAFAARAASEGLRPVLRRAAAGFVSLALQAQSRGAARPRVR